MGMEYTISPKDRVITSIKTKSFADMAESVGSTVEFITGMIYVFRNNATYRPLYWELWAGSSTLPIVAVTNLEVFLAAVSALGPPDLTSLRNRAFWKMASWLNSAAAAVGPINSTMHGQAEWNDPTKGPMVSMKDPALSRVKYGFALLAHSNVTHTFGLTGQLIFEEQLIQREWGNDNAFRDREIDGILDEDEMDEE